MKFKEPKNANYTAIVVEIKTLVDLENCNNVRAAIILNNQVIVDKNVKAGDKGLFFSVENQLSKEFMKSNNLYRDKLLNLDPEAKPGYFDENGRVRCQKFMKNASEGFYIPINSLEFTGINLDDLTVGDEFDELNGIEICRKYVVKANKTPGAPGSKKNRDDMNRKMEDKLVEKQFKFHEETNLLFKYPNRIKPDTIVHISYKEHGSSGISSNVLVKKKLNFGERLLKLVGVDIPETEYGYIYSSGKPKSKLPKGIIGKYINKNGDFYSDDIWKQTFEDLKDFLVPGRSIYYEIVGYTKSGALIQRGYDYGCVPPDKDGTYKLGINYNIVIYRVTMTGQDGTTVEFSPKQVQYWAIKNGLTPVYELFYGYAKDLFKTSKLYTIPEDENEFGNEFLKVCKELYNEKNCFMCKNKVPEEGCVIRIDGLGFEAYKVKSVAFNERETKQLDKGETNIEDEG